MIFGRKKQADQADLKEQFDEELEQPTDLETDSDDLSDDAEQTAADADEVNEQADIEADGTSTEQAAVEAEDESAKDTDPSRDLDDPRWDDLDAHKDWREDGPFDFDEVDLDADEVERLDLGTVIFTPFDGMNLQLQVDEQTNQVQAVLAAMGNSAIEVSLFAAPAQTSMIKEIRHDMAAATEQIGGTMQMGVGPFGTELRRVIPMKDTEGKDAFHVSRTWFAQGPRWLLRGVVMGEAALETGTEGTSELFYEFFCNCVVRRDEQPRVPGDLIPMQLPEGLVPTHA